MNFRVFRGLLPIAALALSAVACSTSNEASAQGANDITAASANEHGLGLQSHLLTKEPASVTTAAALGITSWDVFAGADRENKFSGTVFYASDANGDVKYAFASDTAAHSVTFLTFNKDGSPASNAIDPAAYTKLTDDVQHLTEKVKAAPTWGDCLTGVAVGGLALVGSALIVLGTPVGWYGLFVGTGAALDAGLVGLPTATVLAYALGITVTAKAVGVVVKLANVVESVPASCGL